VRLPKLVQKVNKKVGHRRWIDLEGQQRCVQLKEVSIGRGASGGESAFVLMQLLHGVFYWSTEESVRVCTYVLRKKTHRRKCRSSAEKELFCSFYAARSLSARAGIIQLIISKVGIFLQLSKKSVLRVFQTGRVVQSEKVEVKNDSHFLSLWAKVCFSYSFISLFFRQ